MDNFYSSDQLSLQGQFGTRDLAEVLSAVIVSDTIPDDQKEFITNCDFFFLSTVNDAGEPTVSYKGGAPGFVRIESPRSLLFPSYDGNGMFLSLGNIQATAKVGMLFIDMETPNRVRVQGSATIATGGPSLEFFPGADAVVQVDVTAAFVNCGRYIHTHSRLASSPSIPTLTGEQPLAAWKRVDVLQDFLPERDRGKAQAGDGTISAEEYADKLRRGEV